MADRLLDRLLTGEKHRNRIVRRRAAAVRLRHVLFNLAGNGIKFTETGGVAVIVKPGEHESDICFLVRDTDIGLKPEDQARVFRDFDARARGIAEFRSARTARRCRTDV
jgi:signal transduction histidine kinase